MSKHKMSELEKQFKELLFLHDEDGQDYNALELRLKEVVTLRCAEICKLFEFYRLSEIGNRRLSFYMSDEMRWFQRFYDDIQRLKNGKTIDNIFGFYYLKKEECVEEDEMMRISIFNNPEDMPYKFGYKLFWSDALLNRKFSEFEDYFERELSVGS